MSTETRSHGTNEEESDPREPFEWFAERYDEDHYLGRAARIALQSLEESSEANR
jgi:hypothetical protein